MEANSRGDGGIIKKKRGPFAEVFGQFATREFWKELVKTLVQEAITTFLIAFGGTIAWYGRSRRNKDVAAASGAGVGGEASSKAFGGGFSPNPSFFSGSNNNSYPVAANPGGDTRYPGF